MRTFRIQAFLPKIGLIAAGLALLLFLYSIQEIPWKKTESSKPVSAGALSEFVQAADSQTTETAVLLASELYAGAAVLMDAETGRVLYEKNGTKELANASTTKILTCILILEQCDLDAVAEASGKAAGQPKVHLGMRSGQKFYVRDMLYALMLESFNDCAVVLAEYAAGSVEEFAKEMKSHFILKMERVDLIGMFIEV